MPGTHLVQTKRIIKALRSAGYKRNEFQVRTPYSKSVEGYGKTEIWIRTAHERQEELIDNVLAQGINATRFVLSNGYNFFSYEEANGDQGKLDEWIIND